MSLLLLALIGCEWAVRPVPKEVGAQPAAPGPGAASTPAPAEPSEQAPSSVGSSATNPPSTSAVPDPAAPPAAPSPTLPADAVEKATTLARQRILPARYMEQGCEPTSMAGWDGYPLQRCEYTAGGRSATVILLDADEAQLARWIVDACVEVKGAATDACIGEVVNAIHTASGGQFPVAGVVLEDMDADASFNNFCFRNGVTVSVNAFSRGVERQLTEAEINGCIDGQPTDARTYARIISTTREDWSALHPDAETTGLLWLEVSKAAWQAAWGHDRNELIVAKVKAGL